MAFRFFERYEHAEIYQKYMIRAPKEVHNLILSYLEKKKSRPFGLMVDVGCGNGQSTQAMAAHFQKVIGIDISEAQIQVAKSVASPPNVFYQVAPAEKLPLDDGSVDLITASVAVHFFNIKEFLKEVDRVLKPNGCVAMYCLQPHLNLYYKYFSQHLTDAYREVFDNLTCGNGAEIITGLTNSEYEEIFDAVHFTDKIRVTKIDVKFAMSVSALVGFVESFCTFQNYFSRNPDAGKEFLQKLQER
ncbi:uncharacterized protein LOC144769629 [Lissotriton helveticus]